MYNVKVMMVVGIDTKDDDLIIKWYREDPKQSIYIYLGWICCDQIVWNWKSYWPAVKLMRPWTRLCTNKIYPVPTIFHIHHHQAFEIHNCESESGEKYKKVQMDKVNREMHAWKWRQL